MQPIDYRNETWEDVQKRVEGLRRAVYYALRQHGPCTTRELAQKSGIDLLTVRPRVTELHQIGFVELASPEPGAGEGQYQAVLWPVVMARFEQRRRETLNPQMTLL
jgi:predicted transcriptional regulator